MPTRKILLICLLFAVPGILFTAGAQNKNRLYLQYIDDYKELAIDQMRKYNIPASITLSQGLLESGAGTGTLARKSNNHFGIKCHNNWTGERVYHDDDAKGECFRKYKHPKESYEDHSLFLTRNMRYASLFELKVTDYRGWARGLQQAGYATDKAYASKLIQLIELYELYQYDNKKSGRTTPTAKKSETAASRPVYKAYGLLYVEAAAGETPETIAREMGLRVKRICRYNELPKDFPLEQGSVIYLDRKNRMSTREFKTHTVKAGESMHEISQRYGMKLKSLYKINRKKGDYIPSEGDVLKLRY